MCQSVWGRKNMRETRITFLENVFTHTFSSDDVRHLLQILRNCYVCILSWMVRGEDMEIAGSRWVLNNVICAEYIIFAWNLKLADLYHVVHFVLTIIIVSTANG